MRARHPDSEGFVERGGLSIGYEVFGEGDVTLLLLPTWTIIHSRFWKLQVPYLARHFRVITYDGPGNGRSDRTVDPQIYSLAAQASHAIEVMDETRTDEAVLVSLSKGSMWSLSVAAEHPDRVLGQVFIGPSLPITPPAAARAGIEDAFWAEHVDPQGWEKYNAHYWQTNYEDFAEFFFSECFPEPHSTKQREDCVGWALETQAEVLVAEAKVDDVDHEKVLELCSRVTSPVLVIHGDHDRISPLSRARRLAEATGGSLVTVQDGGHIPLARDPVVVNQLIREFAGRISGPMGSPIRWGRGLNRRKRVLYVSSPIGLGHARRDVAIAKELKKLRPDLEIDWLAQDPVTRVLEAEGEAIHPASEWLASESAHIASEASGHDLHCFQALRRMDEILVANFMIFQEVMEEGLYDLSLGDEAWDIDHFWHENPELKRGDHVWMTDFVGFLPMPSGGSHEEYLTADYNAEMIEHIARYPRIRDLALFVGNPDDIVPETFGPGLPKIRDWTEEHFQFTGYITGFEPPTDDEMASWRSELGYGEDEKVCVVTVGGSGVGRDLLEKVIAAYPLAKQSMPELRMVVVAGPRIDPAGLPVHGGLEYHGYVHGLYRHLAVCDLAIVQGGLTTTMELAAARTPFLYFPLRNHFEQNYHVRHRLDRYGAGQYMDYAVTDPAAIATEIISRAGAPVDYLGVESNGAAKAAKMIADLI